RRSILRPRWNGAASVWRPWRGLTGREEEVLKLMARGRSGAYIAEHLVISQNTVKTHVKHIYAKLDAHSQQDVVDLVFEADASV
uniref:response regulator transcription factor n=1 Tax=Eggerthella sinensis TaxID=242230 RepID=UPI0022DFE796